MTNGQTNGAAEAAAELQRHGAKKGAARLIPAMAERVAHDFQPLRIILFGSHARGDADLDSDVDLLIVLPEGTDRRQAAIDIRRALAAFPVSKDIIVTTPDEIARRSDLIGPVLRLALRDGKVLYDRG